MSDVRNARSEFLRKCQELAENVARVHGLMINEYSAHSHIGEYRTRGDASITINLSFREPEPTEAKTSSR